MAAERSRRLTGSNVQPWVTSQLAQSSAPVVMVSDYVRSLPDSIRAYVPASCVTLGTDGFGRSDTRARLRDFFEVDSKWIAYTALDQVVTGPETERRAALDSAAALLELDRTKPLPTSV